MGEKPYHWIVASFPRSAWERRLGRFGVPVWSPAPDHREYLTLRDHSKPPETTPMGRDVERIGALERSRRHSHAGAWERSHYGSQHPAEVHGYEAHGIGKVK